MQTVTRRQALVFGVGATAFLTVGDVGPSFATPAESDAEIAKFTGGKALEKGKITIDLPEIAENGNTVPLSIAVDSPMTADRLYQRQFWSSPTAIRGPAFRCSTSRRCRDARRRRPAFVCRRLRTSSSSPRRATANSSPTASRSRSPSAAAAADRARFSRQEFQETVMAEKPRLKVPKEAKKGEVIELKTLLSHPMETGFRKDASGKVDAAQDHQQVHLRI